MYKGTVKIFQGLRPRPSNRLTIRRSPRHPTRRPPRSRRLRWPRGGSPPRHVKVTLGNGCVAVKLCSTFMILGGGNSNIFYFHPYLGQWSNLTNISNIFQMSWNHQLYSLWFILFKRNCMCVYSSWLARICVVKKVYVILSRNEGQKFTATSLAKPPFWMNRSVVLGDLQLANQDRSLEFTWQ